MSYIASNPNAYLGKSVGNGQCVAFVVAASHAPHTAAWRRGASVKSETALQSGTAIATFDSDDRYGSRKDGSCHTAIYIRRTTAGIVVYDQWVTHGVAQKVHERTIRFGNKHGKKINNGDEYYVVE